MMMSPPVRKTALITHVVSSVGWLGAVLGFLPLSLVGLQTADPQLAHACDLAMGLMALWALAPLAVLSLLSGVAQALGTPWGLFQHYWVLIKLLITLFAAVVLLMKLGSITALAAIPPGASLSGERSSILAHALGGLVLLLAATALSVLKPQGLTRHGYRLRARSALRAPTRRTHD